MTPFKRGLFVVVLLLGWTGSAAAAVLYASPVGGHVRVRESCRRHESAVDVRGLLRADDAVPLENWEPAGARVEGLESTAAASSSSMTALSPCRLIDTRPGSTSALAGVDVGAFSDTERRTYTLRGHCGIPTEATAVSINLAIVPGATSGFASVGPGGSIPASGPDFASINFVGSGPALSNSLVVPLDSFGRIVAYAARSADVIIDTNGYFGTSAARTVYVPGDGNSAQNGTRLLEAAAEINAAHTSSVWKLELGPGVFDLGGNALSITRQVTIEGAGATTSIITCHCPGATVAVSRDASELRNLGIDSRDPASVTSALYVNGASDSIVQNVRVDAEEDGIGIVGLSTGVILRQVVVFAAETGIAFASNSSGDVYDSSVHAGTDNAVSVTNLGVTIRDSELHADSLAPLSVSNAGSAIVQGSHLSTGGGASWGTGSGAMTLVNSFVDTAATSLNGTRICRGVATPAAFHTNACP